MKRERERNRKKIFEEIMAEDFYNLMKRENIYTQETKTKQTKKPPNSKQYNPKEMHTENHSQVVETQCQRILKAVRKKCFIIYKRLNQ